ncbi:MAG: hypothetical protein ACM3SR_04180 [Ignavibacteriales bacterium]|jgi:integrase/recombinase XerD
MRTPSRKTKFKETAKNVSIHPSKDLKGLIETRTKLWRKHHLTYDQARYVSKEVRKALEIKRVKTRKRVVQRLSREEERRLIQQAYKDKSAHGL